MRTFIKRLLSAQRGRSLLELTVVAAIISILASLTAVAVTGTTSTARSVSRASDISEMQKAVMRFEGETGTYPTTSTYVADSTGVEGTDYFQVVEGPTGVNFDVNDDGDVTDALNVVPIDWDAVAPDNDARIFASHFIGKLKHADIDSPIMINGNAEYDELSQAWVVDETGRVLVLVGTSAY